MIKTLVTFFSEIKKKKVKVSLKNQVVILKTEVVAVQPCVTGQFGVLGLICLERDSDS